MNEKDSFKNSSSTRIVVQRDGASNPPKNEREEYDVWIEKNSKRNDRTKRSAIFCFGLLMLAGLVITVMLLAERTAFDSENYRVGPRGPQGSCLLNQTGQLFEIAGTLQVGNGLIVSGNASFDSGKMVIYDGPGTCVSIDFPFGNSLCVKQCVRFSCIKSADSNPLVFRSDVIFQSNAIFNATERHYGTIYANDSIVFGDALNNASMRWNGSSLVFSGSIDYFLNPFAPLIVGNVGSVLQIGNCLTINSTGCINLIGNVSLQGFLKGNFTADPYVLSAFGMKIFDQSHGLIYSSSSSSLDLYSSQSINVNSSSSVFLRSPQTFLQTNVSSSGYFVGTTRHSGNWLFECFPGPKNFSMGFSSDCSCFKMSSNSKVCLDSPLGFSISGGPFVFNASNLTFSSNSGIAGDFKVYDNAIFESNLTVEKDLSILGNFVPINLLVPGTTTLNGPLTVNSPNATMIALNAKIITSDVFQSLNLTRFSGQGAVFNVGSTASIQGILSITSLPSNVRCSTTVFYPDTPSTPNPNPCVLECPDFQRCNSTFNALTVKTDLKVGTDFNNSIVGSAYLGQVYARELSEIQMNAKLVKILSPNPVEVLGDADVSGNILQGSFTHPCCTGDLIDHENKLLVLQINSVTSTILLSETDFLPFDIVENPASLVASIWNPITHTFTASSSKTYTFTVYVAFDPSNVAGTLRGVTMVRPFTYPSLSPQKIRICAFPMPSIPSAFSQITCIYTAYFLSGETANLALYYDYNGPITILGRNYAFVAPTTRLEIKVS